MAKPHLLKMLKHFGSGRLKLGMLYVCTREVSRKKCWSTSGECVDTPKAAWDTFATLFSKKNDVTLQLLENELMSVVQQDLMNTCYTKI